MVDAEDDVGELSEDVSKLLMMGGKGLETYQ